MRRIAVISDIHGNDIAYEVVIRDAAQRGITEFILAGDLVSDFPFASEVIARTKKLPQAYVIRGNREDYFEEIVQDNNPRWRTHRQYAALLWSIDRMTPEEFSFLFHLPTQLTLQVEDTRITIAHRAPNDVVPYIKPRTERENFLRAMEAIPSGVLICGHTHRQELEYLDGKLFLNPGSCGISLRSEGVRSEYAILTVDGASVSAELFSLPYSERALLDALKASGITADRDAAAWLNLILASLRDGQNHVSELFAHAEKIKREQGISSHDIPNDIWQTIIDGGRKEPLLLPSSHSSYE